MKRAVFITCIMGCGIVLWLIVPRDGGSVRRADACMTLPQFIARVAPPAARSVAIDTTQRGFRGVRLRDARSSWTWQHPTWSMAPFATHTRDDRGTIYLTAAPHVRFSADDAQAYRVLYVIDHVSGELVPFATLPIDVPHGRNPYGAIDVAYDCSARAIYVSHVAGSTPTEQRGGVLAVDRETRRVREVMRKRDVLGIAIMYHGAQPYLYYGDARTPTIRRVRLPLRPWRRPEVVARIPDDLRAVRMRARNDDTILITMAPFSYSLVTQSDVSHRYALLRVRTLRDDAEIKFYENLNQKTIP